jgi:Protein of unknown function (DUF692)
MTSNPNTPGVGLRLAHLAEMVATRPPAGWLEVHPENFLANPHAAELLSELSAHYPISFSQRLCAGPAVNFCAMSAMSWLARTIWVTTRIGTSTSFPQMRSVRSIWEAATNRTPTLR